MRLTSKRTCLRAAGEDNNSCRPRGVCGAQGIEFIEHRSAVLVAERRSDERKGMRVDANAIHTPCDQVPGVPTRPSDACERNRSAAHPVAITGHSLATPCDSPQSCEPQRRHAQFSCGAVQWERFSRGEATRELRVPSGPSGCGGGTRVAARDLGTHPTGRRPSHSSRR